MQVTMTTVWHRHGPRMLSKAARGFLVSKRTFKNSPILASGSKTVKRFPELRESDYDVDGNPDYIRLILTSRVYDVVEEGGLPLTHAVNLSQRFNAKIYMKRDDLLPVFSFKLRGAHNMIANLQSNSKKPLPGVIACSAGNHAQGVAYSSNRLGILATIVMPTTTPSIKYRNVSRLGSQVVLYGDDFDAAKKECQRLASTNGLLDIPPFNHPYVIAGQGTIALEITRQLRIDKCNAVFVPVGGGGLIAGVAVYLKKIAPHIKIIGVETYDADALYQSLKARDLQTLKTVGTFADGTAVKVLGDESWRICREHVDSVVRVLTDELCAAIKDIFEDTRLIVEPSGALSVAGLKKYILESPEIDHSDKTYVPILSGANMNFDRLRFVSERALLGEGREVSLAVTIPDIPGEFVKLQQIIEPRSITEFSYRHSGSSAHIFLSFSANDKKKELEEIISAVEASGNEVIDISDNELAKSHGRYLIGGRSPSIERERMYRFEFPERPGALNSFLNALKSGWNITLFHYRNHGNDIGKVLCGFELPTDAREEDFQQFLDSLGYRYVDESNNVVYQKFL